MKPQIGGRPVISRESEKERRFWESYWKALADERVRSERFIWHERAIQRFIRFISPKRLRDCDSKSFHLQFGVSALLRPPEIQEALTPEQLQLDGRGTG